MTNMEMGQRIENIYLYEGKGNGKGWCCSGIVEALLMNSLGGKQKFMDMYENSVSDWGEVLFKEEIRMQWNMINTTGYNNAAWTFKMIRSENTGSLKKNLVWHSHNFHLLWFTVE